MASLPSAADMLSPILNRQEAEFVNVVALWWRDQRAIEKAHRYARERYFKDSKLSLQCCHQSAS